jgi:hypothetical protein
MKINKIISYTLISYIIIDLLHLIFFRQKETNGDGLKSLLTESYHENIEITFIKLLFCVLALLGLFFSNKNKIFNYLTLFASLGMIYLFLFKGPLNYFYKWYSTISLWVLFFLGVYLLYISFVKLRRKE